MISLTAIMVTRVGIVIAATVVVHDNGAVILG